MTATATLLALLSAHALADYPLQGDFLARAKNPRLTIPGVPWFQAMWAHGAIHGGAVGWITGMWQLGVAEFMAHCLIDYLKCTGRFGSGERAFSVDQGLHIVCKVVWVWILFS